MRNYSPLKPNLFFLLSREYYSLVTRMLSLGMLALCEEPVCINGIFAVHKEENSSRLIIDARKANLLFAVRLSRHLHALYIDDAVVFDLSADSVNGILDDLLLCYKAATLPVKQSKLVWATSTGIEILGLWLSDGSLRLHSHKLSLLVRRTMALVARGSATGLQVESVLGSWIWAMLVRRPALSVLKSCTISQIALMMWSIPSGPQSAWNCSLCARLHHC